MASNEVFLLGSSTFRMRTPTGETIANAIGRAISESFDSYAQNALQIREIPETLFPRILNSEYLVLHIGIMEFLPCLKKRLYPCLKVQKRNGFFYEIEFEQLPPLEKVMNSYNRICFKAQLRLRWFLREIDQKSLLNFVTSLTQDAQSKIVRVFLISAPPTVYPNSLDANCRVESALQEINNLFINVSIISYTEMTHDLHHDSTGHLIESERQIFVTRVATAIKAHL